MSDDRKRAVGILRAWLAGSDLSTLPPDAEAILRGEVRELAAMRRRFEWVASQTHEAGQQWLDRAARSDLMRGFNLGVGRGLQMAATSYGHLLNVMVRRFG